MAIIWMFENQNFNDAWVPFDTINQKRLEFTYRHHDELAQHFKESLGTKNVIKQPRNKISVTTTAAMVTSPPLPTTTTGGKISSILKNNIDIDEEDPSAFDLIQFKHNCISIVLKDSHFDEPITLYPHMLLASLSDKDILVARMKQDSITLEYYH
ncbi:hypothetical protein INT45_001485 [Circinella minor]|uniref:Uncharacterized protein n=1 Tax=Circinella minor TaxID=1195481 RepID=A0A8H7VJL3_9FUNG|nr:hypothetical protein INT45_001485 [Circinella minor]